MNTLLLAPELFTTDSGIPRMLRLYLKALCDLAGPADQVRFVTLNDPPAADHRLAAYSGPALVEWAAANRNKRRFVRQAWQLSKSADVVLCGHVAQLPVAWFINRLRPRLRVILIAHGIEVWRSFSFWERLALRHAHQIFCVSDYTRQQLLAFAPVDRRKLLVVPNTLDPELAASTEAESSPAQPPILLSVARLSAADSYKGLDHLIRALPAIRAAVPQARLRIVGRGDDLDRLRAIADAAGVTDAVKFTGFVDDAALRAEFARCTLFALPSAKEGFGLVYLEAMTAGKPCLAAAAAGAPEVVTSDCGRTVPYGDVPAIAAAAISILGQSWNPATIRQAADRFSFLNFKQRLVAALSS